MAINFKQLVESQLILEQFNPATENFATYIRGIFNKLYQNNPSLTDLEKYFYEYGRDLDRGGSGYKTDEELLAKRYWWPLIDTAYKISSIIADINVFNKLKSDTSTPFEQFIQNNSNAANKNDIVSRVQQELDELTSKAAPQDYVQFGSYRLQKLSRNLSQLTIDRYHSDTILNGVIKIAKNRNIKDTKLIEKVLTAPLDYLSGKLPVPEEFDREIIEIGGGLFNFYKTTKQASNVVIDPTVGTIAGQNTPDGQEYINFIKSSSTTAPFNQIKNIGDLQSKAPNAYNLIKEYSYHIRRGDPPFKAFMKKFGKGFETFTKGLEDVGSALARF